MPRIQAPTVAEHRAAQRRALLDAAREILAETGRPPTLARVAERAGLARSSLYQYFRSSGDLLNAVVEDVFPAGRRGWQRRWTPRPPLPTAYSPTC
ncbi:helix-turn-helix domain-containing protein [Nonomuraea sp. N2-4H]|uniref:TetR/AcrR family transcriptional regulator n=1 Tax=Nonomuraea sp. N2-4H TaxID=3128898 RepID=UPI003243A0E0